MAPTNAQHRNELDAALRALVTAQAKLTAAGVSVDLNDEQLVLARFAEHLESAGASGAEKAPTHTEATPKRRTRK